MDVPNAFLHGDINEGVFIELPPGYVPYVQTNSKDTKVVGKLQKSLYGLKQAPRQWYHKFSEALTTFGFKQTTSDHSLFVLQQDSSLTVYWYM